MDDPRVRKSLLFARQGDEVGCLTCERRCTIGPGKLGVCRTRKNVEGELETLVYGDISSMSANPIEKKPLFHFHPGTRALTVGSWSCNFKCPWCQNHDTSKRPDSVGKGEFTDPGKFVALAQRMGCRGTSISLNEPTLFLEWALDVFELARERGLYNTMVTNGYMTPEALEMLVDSGLDAMNVDVKGDGDTVREYCDADVEKVWRNASAARKDGVWVEITTLVIPGINDGADRLRGIARRVAGEVGEDTPWHVSAYHPAYQLDRPPTGEKKLEEAVEVGKEAGLAYVYAGNAPGHRYENTYCPGCGDLLIERYIFRIAKNRLGGSNSCPECGYKIAMIA